MMSRETHTNARSVVESAQSSAAFLSSLASAVRSAKIWAMNEAKPKVPWPHAPLHQLGQRGTYFLTAGTYQKAHHFRGRGRVRVLHRGLLTVARDFGWHLEAWAVFSNHYHFVGH